MISTRVNQPSKKSKHQLGCWVCQNVLSTWLLGNPNVVSTWLLGCQNQNLVAGLSEIRTWLLGSQNVVSAWLLGCQSQNSVAGLSECCQNLAALFSEC